MCVRVCVCGHCGDGGWGWGARIIGTAVIDLLIDLGNLSFVYLLLHAVHSFHPFHTSI